MKTRTDTQTQEAREDNRTFRGHLLFALASAAIITLFVVGYYQTSSSIRSLKTLDVHFIQQDAVNKLLIDILNAETGVRGFLITGNRAYLKAYVDAVSGMDVHFKQIVSSLQGADVMRDELETLRMLIKRYRTIFNGLIDDKNEGSRIDIIDVDFGKTTFDRIRDIIDEFKLKLAYDKSSFYHQATIGQQHTRWAVFALCSVAFALLLWLFSTQQRETVLRTTMARMLEQRNEELESMVSSRTRQLTKLAAQLTRVNEAEKKRLARELHDDLGASLTAARMDASWIVSNGSFRDDDPLLAKANRLITSLDHAITLKRRLTSNLLPPLLSELGLFEALRSLAEDVQQDGVADVTIEIPDDEPALDQATSLALFRIAQEAFTNLRKYSQATTARIAVTLASDQLQLEVTDNGVGFDHSKVSEESFGLTSMKHRAQMIGATLRVVSEPGKGTAIRVILPFQTG